MSWFNARITKSTRTKAPPAAGLPPVTLYVVAAEVNASSGVPQELFVYDVSEDRFDHVATVYDLNTYPTSRDGAVNAGVVFYRRATMEACYSTQAIAQAAADHVKDRLQRVNAEWGQDQGEPFGGAEEFTFDSGDA